MPMGKPPANQQGEKKMETTKRSWWVLGTEAPRYAFNGNFIRGFKAGTAKEALELAKATKDGHRFHSVIEYDKNGDIHVVYPLSDDSHLPF